MLNAKLSVMLDAHGGVPLHEFQRLDAAERGELETYWRAHPLRPVTVRDDDEDEDSAPRAPAAPRVNQDREAIRATLARIMRDNPAPRAIATPQPQPTPVVTERKSLHPDEQPKSPRRLERERFEREGEEGLQRAAVRGDKSAVRVLARPSRPDRLEERIREGEEEDRVAGTDVRLPVEDRAALTFDRSPRIRDTMSRADYIAERKQAEQQYSREQRRRA
jgi:hypothetical protein